MGIWHTEETISQAARRQLSLERQNLLEPFSAFPELGISWQAASTPVGSHRGTGLMVGVSYSSFSGMQGDLQQLPVSCCHSLGPPGLQCCLQRVADWGF